jgi:hypothetical protein
MPLKTLWLIGPRAVRERVKQCSKGEVNYIVLCTSKSCIFFTQIYAEVATCKQKRCKF